MWNFGGSVFMTKLEGRDSLRKGNNKYIILFLIKN